MQYILNFYCHKLKLVIKVDGSIHDTETAKIQDDERQRILEHDGMVVLRFTNEGVLKTLEELFLKLKNI